MPRTKRSERIARALKHRPPWEWDKALNQQVTRTLLEDLDDERDLERDDNAHEPTGGW